MELYRNSKSKKKPGKRVLSQSVQTPLHEQIRSATELTLTQTSHSVLNDSHLNPNDSRLISTHENLSQFLPPKRETLKGVESHEQILSLQSSLRPHTTLRKSNKKSHNTSTTHNLKFRAGGTRQRKPARGRNLSNVARKSAKRKEDPKRRNISSHVGNAAGKSKARNLKKKVRSKRLAQNSLMQSQVSAARPRPGKSKPRKTRGKGKRTKSKSPLPSLNKSGKKKEEPKSTIMLNNFNHSRNVYNNYFINVKQQSNVPDAENIGQFLKMINVVDKQELEDDEPTSNILLIIYILLWWDRVSYGLEKWRHFFGFYVCVCVCIY